MRLLNPAFHDANQFSLDGGNGKFDELFGKNKKRKLRPKTDFRKVLPSNKEKKKILLL
eukprot:UN00928